MYQIQVQVQMFDPYLQYVCNEHAAHPYSLGTQGGLSLPFFLS